jgi:hypothetical protein
MAWATGWVGMMVGKGVDMGRSVMVGAGVTVSKGVAEGCGVHLGGSSDPLVTLGCTTAMSRSVAGILALASATASFYELLTSIKAMIATTTKATSPAAP